MVTSKFIKEQIKDQYVELKQFNNIFPWLINLLKIKYWLEIISYIIR